MVRRSRHGQLAKMTLRVVLAGAGSCRRAPTHSPTPARTVIGTLSLRRDWPPQLEISFHTVTRVVMTNRQVHLNTHDVELLRL